MTPSQLMEAMAGAGAPFEAILIAIRALEEKDAEIAARDNAAAEKRARDAARKKASRGTSEETPGNVTGQSTDVPETVLDDPSLSRLPNENNSNPSTHTHPDNNSPREGTDPADAEAVPASQRKRQRKAKPEAVTPDRPEDVSEQVWSDFLTHRRKLDADLTETALAGFRREAADVGWPLERAISESILRGWRGFKAKWVKDDERSTTGWGSSPGNGRTDKRDAVTRNLHDRIQRGMDFGDPSQPANSSGRRDDGEPRTGGLLGYSPA